MRKLLLILFYCNLSAQVGIGTIIPDSNAMLEVLTADKGILLPRVSLLSATSSSPLSSHTKGMVVYNTGQNGSGTSSVFPGLYYNDGNGWIRFNPNSVKVGDLKHSFATADHNGWFLLNGRATSTLAATPQANAVSLGYSANLPNGADLFLKGKTGSETLGAQGGNQTFTISQSNLPNINFTGSTNTTGSHSHSADSFLGDENIGLLTTNGLTAFITETVAKDGTTTTTKTTNSDGAHSHTVSFNSGGSNTPVENVPKYVATNIFIYLGK
ncbi:hypothetical protein NAT51_09050 [Flavobacterium amniphilum]|uniref:hypothetical protein n=1 Tax=Flavobacterium amniphilum TaxID=1834035 RepID=UPI00202A3C66|nr:hypothetical protein [Flavobacterium amniphilum]MCL9805669.1 hypothetical protein [Flavobacterium amniphilum]